MGHGSCSTGANCLRLELGPGALRALGLDLRQSSSASGPKKSSGFMVPGVGSGGGIGGAPPPTTVVRAMAVSGADPMAVRR